jgi:uncharacterized protein YndB with AHSA1/START domain
MISTSDAIVKEITINAKAERVFEALIDPGQRVQWWGAEGRFRATEMESDPRPGGAWLMRGIGSGGKPFIVRGEYRAIDCPRLLEFTWLADWEEDPKTTVVRFDLQEEEGTTKVRLTHSGFTSERARENYQGWPWLLTLLRAHVEKQASDESEG